jgi:GT2 family glycosyltransferase
VTGQQLFISRRKWFKIDGWNEDYWLYFEDVDLCKKMTSTGGKLQLVEKRFFHQHGGASRLNIKTKAIKNRSNNF